MPKPPPPPPAIAYPPPPPPPPPAEVAAPALSTQPHKLSTPLIATIGGGAVAVIGGIVALVTLLGGHDHRTPSADTPPPAVHNAPAPQPSSSTPGAVPSSAPSAAPSSAPSAPAQPAGDTGGGSAIDLGNGVVLVPSAGWSDSGTADAGDADLISPEQNTEFFVTTGGADSADVTSVLSTDIQSQIDNGSFSNLSLGDAEQGATGGSVFDQAAGVPFTATVSTQQGTTELSGTFGELLNSQTGLSAFIIVTALSDADLQSNTDAVNAMVDSLTGPAS